MITSLEFSEACFCFSHEKQIKDLILSRNAGNQNSNNSKYCRISSSRQYLWTFHERMISSFQHLCHILRWFSKIFCNNIYQFLNYVPCIGRRDFWSASRENNRWSSHCGHILAGNWSPISLNWSEFKILAGGW